MQTDQLIDIATQMRRDVLRMVAAVNSGHPGGSLGAADIFAALFFKVMDHNPKEFEMNGIGQDLFFLSNGHISPIFYSALARSGYFPVDELATFRKLNSRLQGHPATHEGLEGVRVATGSLGQGLSVAIGAALAKKLNNDNHIVYTLQGDGELQEGQNWEAFMFAAHHKVDNLIAAVDLNRKQIDGETSEVMNIGDLKAKMEAFGWTVFETTGNDMKNILTAYRLAKSDVGQGKPIMIIFETEMGYPIDFMIGTHKWHGKAPNQQQLEVALDQLKTTLTDY